MSRAVARVTRNALSHVPGSVSPGSRLGALTVLCDCERHDRQVNYTSFSRRRILPAPRLKLARYSVSSRLILDSSSRHKTYRNSRWKRGLFNWTFISNFQADHITRKWPQNLFEHRIQTRQIRLDNRAPADIDQWQNVRCNWHVLLSLWKHPSVTRIYCSPGTDIPIRLRGDLYFDTFQEITSWPAAFCSCGSNERALLLQSILGCSTIHAGLTTGSERR